MKSAFDSKFRKGQAALITMVLTLIFSVGSATSTQADWLTCKMYLAQSTETRVTYVKGLLDGYGVAYTIVSTYAVREKNDPRSAEMISGVASAATGLDRASKPLSTFTVGAVREMLDSECYRAPNTTAGEAYANVLVRLH